MAVELSEYDHPAWRTAIGTGIGYLIILAIMTVVLFAIPWLAFALL